MSHAQNHHSTGRFLLRLACLAATGAGFFLALAIGAVLGIRYL